MSYQNKDSLFYKFLKLIWGEKAVNSAVDEHNSKQEKPIKKIKFQGRHPEEKKFNEMIGMGYRYKRWLSCGDSFNLEAETINENQGAIPIDEPFKSGHWFPYQLGEKQRSDLIYGIDKSDIT